MTTLLYFNARSLRNKFSDLEDILNTNLYELIFITETWLKDTELSSTVINSQRYGIIRNDRKGHGGGVAAIYNANYANKIVEHSIAHTD